MEDNKVQKIAFWLCSHKPNDAQTEDLKSAGYKIINSGFPLIDYEDNTVEDKSKYLLEQVLEFVNSDDIVVIQGEMGLTFRVVTALKSKGIKVVYSTTKRESRDEIQPDGSTKKISVFNFLGYREY